MKGGWVHSRFYLIFFIFGFACLLFSFVFMSNQGPLWHAVGRMGLYQFGSEGRGWSGISRSCSEDLPQSQAKWDGPCGFTTWNPFLQTSVTWPYSCLLKVSYFAGKAYRPPHLFSPLYSLLTLLLGLYVFLILIWRFLKIFCYEPWGPLACTLHADLGHHGAKLQMPSEPGSGPTPAHSQCTAAIGCPHPVVLIPCSHWTPVT